MKADIFVGGVKIGTLKNHKMNHIKKQQELIKSQITGTYTGNFGQSESNNLEKGGVGSGRHKEANFHEGYNYRNRKLKGYDVKKPSEWTEHHEAGSKAAIKHHKVGISDLPASAYEKYEESTLQKAEENHLFKAEGSRGGKIIGHTVNGRPIYEDKNDLHQFMGIHSRNPDHGTVSSRKVRSALKKLSDEDLQKFHDHHKEHGKHYLSDSEEGLKLKKEDKANNPADRCGYTDWSCDLASHYEAYEASKKEVQRRKDGGADDREFRNATRRDRSTPRF